jgi:DNA-binding transcriptional regulator YdaS (Cro superfamily)
MLRAMKLADYIQQERGRASLVAAATGLSAAFIYQVANGDRPCPADRAADIEAATEGAVPRWDLRPLDWHRIWPELVGAEGAPAVPAPQDQAESPPLPSFVR